jgi:hypothetical protein
MQATCHRKPSLAKAALAVQSIGYLVPQSHFDGVVQSVYACACNISYGRSLLTLIAPGVAEGPTALLLGRDCAIDLRTCFRVGDAVVRHGGRMRSRGTEVDLTRATGWMPRARPIFARASQVLANLRFARARLVARPRYQTSILHREGHAACAGLEEACRACDFESALPEATRLIGWGEGLTPAGDDFLVGLMSGLDALAATSSIRRNFLRRLSAAISARAAMTTPIAAHYLGLAASGHFTADLHRLRDALLSASEVASLQQPVDDTLALGATSGGDLVAGLLSGVFAWLDSPLPAQGSS